MGEVPADGKRGGADDTLAVPVMWGDVDFGTEGHKRGEALPATMEDALMVIREAGLGEPTVLIHSGGGLYPIWVLDRAVDRGTPPGWRCGPRRRCWPRPSDTAGHTGPASPTWRGCSAFPGRSTGKTANPRPCRAIGGTEMPVSPDVIPEPAVREPSAAPGRPGGAPLPPRREYDPNRPRGPMDVLADEVTWAQLLEPAGWTCVGTDNAGELWLRPGGDATSMYSARCFGHNLVCHSETASLPSGSGQRLTKGRVYAYLYGYNGDLSAATRALLRGRNPAGLPNGVLDQVAAECRSETVFGGRGSGSGGSASRTAAAGHSPQTTPPCPAPPVGYRPGLGLDPVVAAALEVGLARRRATERTPS